MPGHEVDHLRRDFLRRDRQVSLVLAILVIDDDDHLAISNCLDGGFDRREGRLLFASVRGHGIQHSAFSIQPLDVARG